jgi:AcrR family transcriptional regulator
MTDTEISRRERKKEGTRRRIFDEAVRLFRERGFEATTIDEIAERADVAKGTFFNHFPRKESVLNYLSETRLVEAEAGVEELLAARKPAREKLIQVYQDAAVAYEADRELTRYVLTELMHLRFAPTEELGVRWESLIARVFEQGQASGELRADVPAQQAIDVLTSIYYSLLFMWSCCTAGPAGDFDLRTELRARLRLVLDGLALRKEAAS